MPQVNNNLIDGVFIPKIQVPPSTLFIIGPPSSGKKSFQENFARIVQGTGLSDVQAICVEDYRDKFDKRDVFGVALLFDASKPNVKSDMSIYFPFVISVFGKTKVIVHATKGDLCSSPTASLYQIREAMNAAQIRYPLFNLDPRRPNDVISSIVAILNS